ncbi:MAG: hypothetical protein ACI8UO_002305 [Verrucomicrobiales bacterium]|jgi:hypothetical protein
MRRVLTIVLCLIIGAAAAGRAQEGEDPFFFADMSRPPFDASQITAEDKILTVLRNGGAILARNIRISNRTRAQLIAVSLTIDPEHKLAFDTNALLRKKETPPPILIKGTDGGEQIDVNVIAQDLLAATYVIYGDFNNAKNKEALKLVAMLYDICVTIYPTDTELKYSREIFLENNSEAAWDEILKPSDGKAAEGSVNPPQTMRPLAVRGLELKNKKSEISGLRLVVSQTGIEAAASRMSATHMENVRDEGATRRLRLILKEGKSSSEGLDAIADFMELRHGDWIKDGVIEFAFRDRNLMEEKELVSLACGLMVEGLVAGEGIDPGFACVGAMKADGSVQPVAGPLRKLRSARIAGCKVVALPNANRFAVIDLAILGQAGLLSEVQIFIVGNFDHAWSLARTARPEAIQESIDEFAGLQKSFASDGVLETIRSTEGKATLERILARTPNHASARLMLGFADGQLPSRLSLNGSVEELLIEFGKLTAMVDLPLKVAPSAASELKDFQESVARLKEINVRVELRAKAYSDALLKFAEAMEGQKRAGGSAAAGTQLHERGVTALKEASAALKQIQTDPELLERF